MIRMERNRIFHSIKHVFTASINLQFHWSIEPSHMCLCLSLLKMFNILKPLIVGHMLIG